MFAAVLSNDGMSARMIAEDITVEGDTTSGLHNTTLIMPSHSFFLSLWQVSGEDVFAIKASSRSLTLIYLHKLSLLQLCSLKSLRQYSTGILVLLKLFSNLLVITGIF